MVIQSIHNPYTYSRSIVAIIITKQLFGGLGYNIFNPALIGRAFLLISFRAMTIWTEPNAAFFSMDAKTAATPRDIEGRGPESMEVFGDAANLYSQLLFGHRQLHR